MVKVDAHCISFMKTNPLIITVAAYLTTGLWLNGQAAPPVKPDKAQVKIRDVYYCDPSYKPMPKAFLVELQIINQKLDAIQTAQSNLLAQLSGIALDTNRTSVERREAVFCIGALNTDAGDRWLVDHILLSRWTIFFLTCRRP
jgi:hypothetical protein